MDPVSIVQPATLDALEHIEEQIEVIRGQTFQNAIDLYRVAMEIN
jgi:hypothetical protein